MSLTFCKCFCFFFFSSRRRHTRSFGDWSSDVCSSDLTLMLIVALPFVVLPLWRDASSNAADNEVQRDAANLEILRDQLAELEADLRDDLLTQDAYEQGKRELQARLLEEVKATKQPPKAPRHSARVLAIVLATSLPLFSVPLYLALGNTKALLSQQDSGMAGDLDRKSTRLNS